MSDDAPDDRSAGNPPDEHAVGDPPEDRGGTGSSPAVDAADGGAHLGHVHLKVRDADRAVAFYTDVVPGLTVRERVGGFVFLSAGDPHHELALQAVDGDAAPGPESNAVGLYHAAWEVPDRATLRTAYERLQDRGVAVSPVDHGISEALYFTDPDGNGVELYCDTRAEKDRAEWGGRDRPLDPESL